MIEVEKIYDGSIKIQLKSLNITTYCATFDKVTTVIEEAIECFRNACKDYGNENDIKMFNKTMKDLGLSIRVQH